MAVNDPGGIGPQTRLLREAIGGNPIEQVEEAPQESAQAQNPPEVQQTDQSRLRESSEVQLRTLNTDFQQVQEQIITNRITSDSLAEIRNEIRNLQDRLQNLGDEPLDIEEIGETLNRIDQLAESARFNNVPLLDDFNSESLGIRRLETSEVTETEQTEQQLLQSAAQVDDRLDQAREQEVTDRRELESLQVAFENVSASRNSERISEIQEIEENLREIQADMPRGEEAMNLTADRVMELI